MPTDFTGHSIKQPVKDDGNQCLSDTRKDVSKGYDCLTRSKTVITNLNRKQERQLKGGVEGERIFSTMTVSWKFLCGGLQGGRLLGQRIWQCRGKIPLVERIRWRNRARQQSEKHPRAAKALPLKAQGP